MPYRIPDMRRRHGHGRGGRLLGRRFELHSSLFCLHGRAWLRNSSGVVRRSPTCLDRLPPQSGSAWVCCLSGADVVCDFSGTRMYASSIFVQSPSWILFVISL